MMEHENHTFSSDFILLGLFSSSQTSQVVFTFIFFIFIITITENALMILLIHRDSRLHTPMYFLLSHLSFMDIMHISNIVPKMIADYLSGSRTISFAGCGFQVFLSLTLLGGECLLLAAMSYDRYVAICHPLRYPVLMRDNTSGFLASGSWLVGILNSIVHTFYALHIPYCHSRSINHFFCDVPAMLPLACMDTWVYEYMVFVSTSLFLLLPFLGITASYGRVLFAVFHMRSTEGKKKAFTTCSTHLTVVTFYYAPFVYTYLRPRSLRSPTEDKILAVFYTILTPMLNPIIYSLRNKEVLGAMTRVFGSCYSTKH
ncbi:Olfactory receptor 2AJ1 [Lemmus lemmus]